MKVQEVILRAMSGQLTWLQAGEILRLSPRSVRRWRWRYERYGYDGLMDRRRRQPSLRRAPVKEVERVLRLYRQKYSGFNVRHFHQLVVAEHGVTLSYSLVKAAVQGAGLVKKHRSRGRHRLRREPRPCLGEMLHIDGSPHGWLSLCPDERQTLVDIVDDATGKMLYAQLVESESTETVMRAQRAVFLEYGLPMAFYTDRASWAAHTPKAGEPVDKNVKTQVGRALASLGIEHIVAYSPQARGRSERAHRTLQDRLVNELRVAKIRSVEQANRYLRERFLPDYNRRFGRVPKDPESAFVPVREGVLDQILCHQESRTVGKDNTVVLDKVRLQIAKQPGRRTCAGLVVSVRRHLNATHSIWLGSRCLGLYDALGQPSPKTRAGGGLASRGAASSVAA